MVDELDQALNNMIANSPDELDLALDTMILQTTSKNELDLALDKMVTPESVGILGQVKEALKETYTPFSTTREEQLASVPQGAGEAAARIGTSIVANIATTSALAKAGAVIGTAVAPGPGTLVGAVTGTVAGLSWGLYQAIGQEYVASTGENRDFSYKNLAVNAATEINPVLKYGGKIPKIAKAVTQGGLQYAQASQYGADSGMAGLQAVIAGALGAAANSHGIGIEDFRSAGQAAVLAGPKASTKDLAVVQNALDTGDTSAKLEQVAQRIAKAQKPDADLKRQITNLDGTFEESYKEQREVYDKLLNPKQLAKGIEEEKLRRAALQEKALTKPREAGEEYSPGYKEPDISKVLPPVEEYVHRLQSENIWNKTNTDFATFVAGNNRLELPQARAEALEKLRTTTRTEDSEWSWFQKRKQLIEAIKETKFNKVKDNVDPCNNKLWATFSDLIYVARGTDNVTGLTMADTINSISRSVSQINQDLSVAKSEIINILKKAKADGLDIKTIWSRLDNPADTDPLLEPFKDFFSKYREFQLSHGIGVGEIGQEGHGYFPQHRMAPADMVVSLHKAVDRIGPQAIMTQADGEGEQIYKILQQAWGKPLTTTKEIRLAIDSLMDPKIAAKVGQVSKSAQHRLGIMPDIIRQKDPEAVMMAYATNAMKAVHLDPVLRKLQLDVQALRATKMKESAKYWSRYLNYLSGTPEGRTLKQMNLDLRKAQLRYTLGDPTAKAGLAQTELLARDLIPFAQDGLYASFLGFRPDKIVRQLAQPMFMLAPELESKAAWPMLAKAYAKVINNVVRAKLSGESNYIKKALGPDLGSIAQDASEDFYLGFNSTIAKTLPGRVITQLRNASMAAFQYAEYINRYATKLVAEEWGEAILAGDKVTKSFLARLPSGDKQLVRQLIQNNDVKGIKDWSVRYLLSKTMLNYGKQAMSQAGREWGSVASMLTKWPASLIGDWNEYRHSLGNVMGSAKFLQKHMYTGAFIAGASWLLGEDAEDPRAKALAGKNIWTMHPTSSMNIGLSPVIDTPQKLKASLEAALRGDLKRAIKVGTKALIPWVNPLEPVQQGLESGYSILTGKDPEDKFRFFGK